MLTGVAGSSCPLPVALVSTDNGVDDVLTVCGFNRGIVTHAGEGDRCLPQCPAAATRPVRIVNGQERLVDPPAFTCEECPGDSSVASRRANAGYAEVHHCTH